MEQQLRLYAESIKQSLEDAQVEKLDLLENSKKEIKELKMRN
jgi:hypothetical protein